VRRMVHAMGFRYRLHRKDLPGKPDLVFPGLKRAIFVHGCFWHMHSECREGRIPDSRKEYWGPKLARNKVRDTQNISKLQALGWQAHVLWECETEDAKRLRERLVKILTAR
jgi:DNA mismatch endonuclease (patch repair protein)